MMVVARIVGVVATMIVAMIAVVAMKIQNTFQQIKWYASRRAATFS